jgi:hypothetical protein
MPCAIADPLRPRLSRKYRQHSRPFRQPSLEQRDPKFRGCQRPRSWICSVLRNIPHAGSPNRLPGLSCNTKDALKMSNSRSVMATSAGNQAQNPRSGGDRGNRPRLKSPKSFTREHSIASLGKPKRCCRPCAISSVATSKFIQET